MAIRLSPPLTALAAALLLGGTMSLAAEMPEPLKAWLADAAGSRLPDYSYAGYHDGESLPPRVVGPEFKVKDFGAVPNDGKDDIAAIQKALDAAAAKGGGVVLFERGTYDFDVTARGGYLKIRGSNIVLRGAGSGKDGTVFAAHQWHDTPVPGALWQANQRPVFIHAGPCETSESNANNYMPPFKKGGVTDVSPAKRKALVLEVATPAALKPGQTYMLTQFDRDGSLVEALAAPMKMADMAVGPARKGITKFYQLVTVKKVDGRQVTLDAPLLFDLDERWQPRLCEIPLLREVGLESLRLRGKFTKKFVHHQGVEMDDGWNHVRFDGIVNGWVRDVVHEDATYCIMMATCKNCIVYNCKLEGAEGHNGWGLVGGSTNNLLLRLDAWKQFHKFQFQGYASGNVVLHCTGQPNSGIDCHGSVGVYNLFDDLNGVGAQHGGADSSTPPRHGQGLTFWNWNPKVVVDDGIPSPILAGGNGTTVEPKSLYEFQHAKRLGKPLPE